MKRLSDIETEEYSLEVYECGCGFHLGIDATYLDICEHTLDGMFCPNCGMVIKVFPDSK